MTQRETALNILYETEYNGAYSNIALKNGLNSHMTAQDRAFVTNIVYGVLQKQITIDYIIGRYSKIKLKKISKYIMLILRMGIYQIKFMDRVPDTAAVNESVKLAKRYGHKASAGFVNGILRSVIRGGEEYPKDINEYLSVKYSYPLWTVKKWVDEFGYEFTEKMLSGFDTVPKLTVRPNTLKITAEELAKKMKNASVEDGLIQTGGYSVGDDKLYSDGFYTVQDKAAATAVRILEPKEGDTVIDMCAAPGGKTTYMAEMMKNKGVIYAFDIYEHKIKLIEENAKRLGINIIKASVRDACVYYPELKKTADKVLADVPCSGWGIVRRKPDIKLREIKSESLIPIQQKILKNAAEYVKCGGELLYSTCTIMREENQDRTEEFLRTHTDFERVYEKTFYPHIDGTDGFYICKMRRMGK